MKSVGVALLIFAAAALAPLAHAKKVYIQFSGSDEATHFSIDSDPNPAFSTLLLGQGSVGSTTRRGLDDVFWDGVTYCGATSVELTYGAAAAQTRVQSGDQFYEQLDHGTACFDFVNLTFTFSYTTKVVGGTGAFEGASGTLTSTGAGSTLQLDSAGNVAMTAYHGVTQGDITLIHPEQH